MKKKQNKKERENQKKIFAVDFETFYDSKSGYTVKEMTYYAYTHDEKFDAYLVSVAGNDGTEFVGLPENFDWSILENATVLMHNASFDQACVERLVEDKIIPNINFTVLDTADMSAYLCNERSLAGAAKKLLGIDMSKDERTKASGKAKRGNVSEELLEYALNDAVVTLELGLKYLEAWPEHERKMSNMNRSWCRRGVRIDQAKLEESIKNVQKQQHEYECAIPWSGDAPTLSPKAFAEECRKCGLTPPKSLAKTDAHANAFLDKYAEQYPWIKAMREFRSVNTFLGKLVSIKNAIMPDGRMQYNVKYFGAHTGRFSGGSTDSARFNMQNMPRGDMFGVNMRSLFLADEGDAFVSVDLSQIEGRLLPWASGDGTLIERIKQYPDLYEANARAWGRWTAPEPLNSTPEGKKLRPYIKASCLGCGYQAGPDKFKEYAKLVCNLDLTREEAAEMVYGFRNANPKIVALWDMFQQAIRNAALGLQQVEPDSGIDPHDLWIELPSGRKYVYEGCHVFVPGIDPDENKAGKKAARAGNKGSKFMEIKTAVGGKKVYMYGGKMTENYIQAMARDLFVRGLIALHDNGFKILFHVHDEADISLPKDGEFVKRCDLAQRLMANPPGAEWTEDCPLASEVECSEHYTKAGQKPEEYAKAFAS
jgi:DNA polymerase I - 3''-5'' exonuclease and polymerase domains